jgi:hypothetical protein
VDLQSDGGNCGTCGKKCDDGQLCRLGNCVPIECPLGTTACFPDCVNLASSGAHCGVCSITCFGATFCNYGTCVANCTGGTTACGNSCVDTNHDPSHCGGCGVQCETKQVCARDSNGTTKCRDAAQGGCTGCPCDACGSRACCLVSSKEGEFKVMCVDGQCAP